MAEIIAPDLVDTRLRPAVQRTPDCDQCGGPVVRRPRGRRDARFCSGRCRARWHAAQRSARLTELDDLLGRVAALVRELRKK
jgi:endogenous inhibitor of DNA gyrase (YacG/DUF329 family)